MAQGMPLTPGKNYYLCLQDHSLGQSVCGVKHTTAELTQLKLTLRHSWGKILRPILASSRSDREKIKNEGVLQIRLYA